jgi:Zn finger protein HypA/HybF involved in hydrogenase expression
MHELTFVKEIFSVLRQELSRGLPAGQVLVNVRLSPFSHVAAQNLQDSFRELSKAESFKDVSLKVLPLELEVECASCKRSSRIAKKVFGCPYCGSADINIKMEREFFVESIEIKKGK